MRRLNKLEYLSVVSLLRTVQIFAIKVLRCSPFGRLLAFSKYLTTLEKLGKDKCSGLFDFSISDE